MNSLSRILLSPFALLYGIVVWFYNKLFDWNIRKSVSFSLPVISVGNLSSGGTGKTPHIEYLVDLLLKKFEVGVLSRGYKRRTKGYLLADKNSITSEIGDEPLQIKLKYPEVIVAVCEERVIGIPHMLSEFPDLQVILLDDAFQHRPVKPALSILLTAYSKPYIKDHLLPAGRLREFKKGADRADVVIVTKCPVNLSGKEKETLKTDLQLLTDQKLFFSSYEYGIPYQINNPEKKIQPDLVQDVLLFCGIADTDFMVAELKKKYQHLSLIHFPDHYQYTERDLKKIQQKFNSIESSGKIIMTTEKDSVRLISFRDWFLENDLIVYCQPIKVYLAEVEKYNFNDLIFSSVDNFSTEQHE